MRERLQKVLAQCGVASRRAAEELITSGRVRVNGRVITTLGERADGYRDRIEVDGKRIVLEKPMYLLFHKPRAVMTTLRDPEGRKTIMHFLRGITTRVYPVGRLDFHTSGALILTNDGELADGLLHPAAGVAKVYVAKVRGRLTPKELEALTKGIDIGDGEVGKAKAASQLRGDIEDPDTAATRIRLVLTEGKNREVHRMFEALDRVVMRLSRDAFAGLSTDGLRPGEFRELTPLEVAGLKKLSRPRHQRDKGMAPAEQEELKAPETRSAQKRRVRLEKMSGNPSGSRGPSTRQDRPRAADPRDNRASGSGAAQGNRQR